MHLSVSHRVVPWLTVPHLCSPTHFSTFLHFYVHSLARAHGFRYIPGSVTGLCNRKWQMVRARERGLELLTPCSHPHHFAHLSLSLSPAHSRLPSIIIIVTLSVVLLRQCLCGKICGISYKLLKIYIQRFAGWLSTGEGKWAVALKCLIRLGCLVQRLTVHCQLPFAYCTGQPTCKPLYELPPIQAACCVKVR